MAKEDKKQDNTNKTFNEEELLKKVEKAAEKGASKSSLKQAFISSLPTIIVIAVLAWMIVPKINALNDGLKGFFKFDEPVADHDMTIDNDGIFGYTAADFEEAILGDSSKLKKLEVYEQKVSDVATLTDTGLANWSIFTKTQLITYNGSVVYTVDLGQLRKSDINFNEEEKTITLKIPHANQEQINIPEDQIQFGDTNKGILAFGDITMTAEQAAAVQAEARIRMQEKLDNEKTIDVADRFAKLVVWELYNPIIKGVSGEYSLNVEFK